MRYKTLDELERQKTQLEIQELQRPWWKKPRYAGAIFPSLVAVFSITYALSSGFFERKNEMLKMEKTQLCIDIEKFKKESHQMEALVDKAKADVTIMHDSLKQIQLAEIRKDSTQMAALDRVSRSRDSFEKAGHSVSATLQEQVEYYKKLSDINLELSLRYRNRVRLNENIIELQMTRIKDASDSSKYALNTITTYKNMLDYCRSQIESVKAPCQDLGSDKNIRDLSNSEKEELISNVMTALGINTDRIGYGIDMFHPPMEVNPPPNEYDAYNIKK